MKFLYFIALTLIPRFALQAQTVNNIFPETEANAEVRAMAQYGDTLFIGGTFTRLYTPLNSAKYGGLFNPAGEIIQNQESPSGFVSPNTTTSISVSLSDGKGGFYIGGSFSKVGDSIRNNIAHIDSFGKVSSILSGLGANNTVSALALAGDTLFIGGSFTNFGGKVRTKVAALLIPSNSVIYWNPQVNQPVTAIFVKGSLVYIGGSFTTVAGKTRNRLAAINRSDTGTLTLWNPSANNTVNTISISANSCYAGGLFTSVGGKIRKYIAALNLLDTGTASNWNPDPDGAVFAIATEGNRVYTGGNFTSIGGWVRNRAAALDTAGSGNATTWDPNVNNTVNMIIVKGNYVYVGGNFSAIAGSTTQKNAAILNKDMATIAQTLNTPYLSGSVSTMSVYGNNIYLGGNFVKIGGVDKKYMAAIRMSTGEIMPWWASPSITDFGRKISVMTIKRNMLYASSDYGAGGGNGYIYGMNVSGALKFQCNVNGDVAVLEAGDDILYAGGTFTTINSITRNYLGALNANTGSVLAWNANITNGSSYYVSCIKISGSRLYIGGYFQSFGSMVRRNLASLDINTAVPDGWLPNPDHSVSELMLYRDKLYVAGGFTYIFGQNHSQLAVLDTSGSGALMPFQLNPGFSGSGGAYLIMICGNKLLLAGTIDYINGQTWKGPALYDTASGMVSPWNLKMAFGNNPVRINCIVQKYNKLFLGGSFGGVKSNLLSITDSELLPLDSLSLETDTIWLNNIDTGKVVKLTSNLSWSISNPVSWMTVSPASGSMNAVLSISVQNNPGASRSARLIVSGGSISKFLTVFQAGSLTDSLMLDKDTVYSLPAGDTNTVDVQSNASWQAASNQLWASVYPESGSGNGIFKIISSENLFGDRSAIITVSTGILNRTVYLWQAHKPTGMPEQRQQANILLYPNPAQGKLLLEWTGPDKQMLIQFFDNNGKLIKNLQNSTGMVEVNTEDLSKGLYLIRVSGQSGDYLHKVILE